MDIYGTPFVPNMRDWARIVDGYLENPAQEPIRNVACRHRSTTGPTTSSSSAAAPRAGSAPPSPRPGAAVR